NLLPGDDLSRYHGGACDLGLRQCDHLAAVRRDLLAGTSAFLFLRGRNQKRKNSFQRSRNLMKLLIASDLHGSAFYCEKLMERIREEQPDRILLLGDLLYHGPRNDLPEGYAPKKVIPML